MAEDIRPYLAPEIGFDVLKDAVALVRCTAAQDWEGYWAVCAGSPRPVLLAAMAAAVAVRVGRHAGLDDTAITALLDQIASEGADFLLDQAPPAGEVSGHR